MELPLLCMVCLTSSVSTGAPRFILSCSFCLEGPPIISCQDIDHSVFLLTSHSDTSLCIVNKYSATMLGWLQKITLSWGSLAIQGRKPLLLKLNLPFPNCSSGERAFLQKDSSLSDLHLLLGEVLAIAVGIWVQVNLSCPHLLFA